MRILEVVDLGNMLRGLGGLKGDAPAMPAGREASAFDYSHLKADLDVLGPLRHPRPSCAHRFLRPKGR
jgi:hypothetical protein